MKMIMYSKSTRLEPTYVLVIIESTIIMPCMTAGKESFLRAAGKESDKIAHMQCMFKG